MAELIQSKTIEVFDKLQIIETELEKKVLVKGQLYMTWEIQDQTTQRMAIVELYKTGIATQEELAKAFGIHIKTIYNYVTIFEQEGIKGLIGERSGPKSNWKITPEVRGKILLTMLREKLEGYVDIQKELVNSLSKDILSIIL